MQHKSIVEIEREYDLEIEKIVKTIKKELSLKKKLRKENKKLLVLLQFPDGLKPYATVIADYIEEKTNVQCLIWLGSCYGACDVPVQVERLKPKIDLIIQFGHSKWKFKKNIVAL